MRAPVAPQVAGSIARLGGGFMLSRQAKAAAAANGLADPWAAYFAGRCGVLGEVDADVVLAAVVFFEPETVRRSWRQRAEAGLPAEVGAERFREACLAWGRSRLAAFDGAARLADLLEPLVDAADPTCAPLFAGWRARPRPPRGDDAARVCLAAHQLREHRMAAHAVAVRAHGMRPLDAILSGVGGVGNAAFFGWPQPYPDVTDLADARVAVEAQTDVLAEPAYDPLTDAEAVELVGLLAAAAEASAVRPT